MAGSDSFLPHSLSREQTAEQGRTKSCHPCASPQLHKTHIHDCHAHPILISMHLSAVLNCLLLWPLYFLCSHTVTQKTPQCKKPLFASLSPTTTPPLKCVQSSLTPAWGRLKGGRRFMAPAVVQFRLCWSNCIHQGESAERRNLTA